MDKMFSTSFEEYPAEIAEITLHFIVIKAQILFTIHNPVSDGVSFPMFLSGCGKWLSANHLAHFGNVILSALLCYLHQCCCKMQCNLPEINFMTQGVA